MKKILLTIFCSIAITALINAATVTWDNGGDGASWTDPLNWDTDLLPTSADDVLIDGFTVVLSSATAVQRVYVSGSGMLTVDAGAVLTIDGFLGDDDGLEVNNSATVINNGQIDISNILDAAADGIYVRGVFTNSGSITIDGIGQHGLYIQMGNFTNLVGGSITITNTGQTNSDGDGIYVDDSSGILGLLTNQGSITVNATTGDDAIYINDASTLSNEGTISLNGTSTSDNGVRLDDAGIFNNLAGAVFNIDGFNDDQVYIDNVGAVFNNAGTINLTNADVDDAGLYVIDDGTFINMMGGTVNIMGAQQYAIQVDANGGAAEIINSGTITVTGSSNDGLRIQEAGVFTNQAGGLLHFITAGDDAIQVDNPGLFDNLGSVDIDAPIDHGMELYGTFNNSGLITIDLPLDNGIYMVDAAIFNNNAGGMLNINDVSDEDHGIQIDANLSATPATLTNGGVITISNSIDHSFKVQENGVFTNNAGATLNIVNANTKGILVETGGIVNNSGLIDIPAAVEEGMDLIDGTFNNMTTGIYRAIGTVDDGLEINGPSVMNNDGILDIDGSGSEDIEVLYGPNFEVPTINNTSNAKFAPGSSPGDLEIRGDFNLGASTITFEIDGPTPTVDYDQIVNTTSSNFLMLGTSKAILDFGTYEPVVGDMFTIITGSGLTLGSFSEVTSTNPSIILTQNNGGTAVTLEVAEILPVELINFSADRTERGTLLKWQTATEINNEGFEIERSHDGGNWSKLGFVRGNGISYEFAAYTFLDESPSTGVNYYRLKQMDYDGKFEYSNIVSSQFGSVQSNIASYPNPVKDVLFLELDTAAEGVEISLFDSNGRVLWMSKRAVSQIPFEAFDSGVYFLEITTASGKSMQKIIK